MTKREILILIINIVSVLPVIAYYPFVILANIMVFAGLNSLDFKGWVFFIAASFYPFFIAGFIILSWRYKSLTFALIGLMPAIIAVWLFFFQEMSVVKRDFEKASRDFVCGKNSFISNNGGNLVLFQKKLLSYQSDFIGSIQGENLLIRYNHRIWKNNFKKAIEFLGECKNTKGESVIAAYKSSMLNEEPAIISPPPYEIRIISPAEGESLYLGYPLLIEWTDNYSGDKDKAFDSNFLFIESEDGKEFKLAENLVLFYEAGTKGGVRREEDGTFSYPIKSPIKDLSGKIIPAGRYRLRFAYGQDKDDYSFYSEWFMLTENIQDKINN